ncbi:hypothetical protein B0H34DRAFT_700932 [Crassisporium funariophilum]|nr:hypothetical protein B0H34DRAFT_700932 [Crassisporium funariophilum]
MPSHTLFSHYHHHVNTPGLSLPLPLTMTTNSTMLPSMSSPNTSTAAPTSRLPSPR